MLQSMGSQRPGHELATEQQQQLVTVTFMYLLKWVYGFMLCMDYYITSLLQTFSFFFFVLIFSEEAIIKLPRVYVWNIFQLK